MAHYLDWVYTKKLPTRGFTLQDPGTDLRAAYELLAKIYVIGHYVSDANLQNEIMTEFSD